jgi:uncharacterized damage-inducible protein DinB
MEIQKELLSEYDRETTKTRKVLESLPDNVDMNWKPHEKSMPLGRLAGHVADMTGDWAIHTLTQDELKFPADHKWEAYVPSNRTALVARFDKDLPKVRAALEALPAEKWDQHWKFIFGDQTWIDQPRYQVWRDMVINHLVHHRAQLGVYLRLLGAKIPGCYGPSADEA